MRRSLPLLLLAALLPGCTDVDRPLAPAVPRLSTGPSVVVVTNLDDAGVGSLRWAVGTVGSAGTVRFATGLTGTVALTSGEIVVERSMTIRGPGAEVIAVHAAELSRVFRVLDTASVTMAALTITGGNVLLDGSSPRADGGGVFNAGALVMRNCVVTGNHVDGTGGGVWNIGNLNVQDCRFTDNTALRGGGAAIANDGTLRVNHTTIAGNRAINETGGGGIVSYSGTVWIDNSTISGNRSIRTAGGISILDGEAYLTNVTVSGNIGREGGGIHLRTGHLTVAGGTIVDNEGAFAAGYGIWAQEGSEVELLNTIVALNDRAAAPGAYFDLLAAGTLKAGNDIIGTPIVTTTTFPPAPGAGYPMTSDLGGNILGVTEAQLALGPLTDNGGPTLTHIPLAGSVAIDAGRNAFTSTRWDQRGSPFERRLGLRADIGAVEAPDPAASN